MKKQTRKDITKEYYRNGTEKRRQQAKTILMQRHREEYLAILGELK